MRVRQRPSGNPVFGKRAAARVAEPAGLDLLAERAGRYATLRISGRRIKRPCDVSAFVEARDEALGGIVASSERPPALPFPRPIDMTRAAAVTGFAADADFCPGRGEAILHRVIVLVHAGRMALGAHEVPVLVQLGPVQEIVVANFFVRIEVEPTLAPLVFRAAVPGDGEGLQSSIGKFDQILLQRVEAERVLDLEHADLAVRPVGLDQELSVLAEESRTRPVVLKIRIVEVAEHRFLGRVIHGMLVLRRSPKLRFRPMAPRAGLAADEGGLGIGRSRSTFEQRIDDAAGEKLRSRTDSDDDRRCSQDYDPNPALGLRGGVAVCRSVLRLSRLGRGRCIRGFLPQFIFRGRPTSVALQMSPPKPSRPTYYLATWNATLDAGRYAWLEASTQAVQGQPKPPSRETRTMESQPGGVVGPR